MLLDHLAMRCTPTARAVPDASPVTTAADVDRPGVRVEEQKASGFVADALLRSGQVL